MKLSKLTRDILANYVLINDSIFLEPGKVLKSRAVNDSIISSSKIEEDFPVRFPISKLTDFLSALSLFNEPDLEFSEGRITISENNTRVNYTAASSKLVKQEDFNDSIGPAKDMSFNVPDVAFKKVMKAAASMGHDWLIVRLNDSGRIVMQSVDSKAHENSRNDFFTTLEEPTLNNLKDFQVIFQVDQLKILDGSYIISVNAEKKSAELENVDTNTRYWLGLVTKSTFKK